mmetsp:Transcript_57206/g.148651  ORF Transcript_57206/g.148651 Transcript_57206/m.148651 type:complete len:234 (+) Transcript_57206:83-784(+)
MITGSASCRNTKMSNTTTRKKCWECSTPTASRWTKRVETHRRCIKQRRRIETDAASHKNPTLTEDPSSATRDSLHCRHVATQLTAYDLNWVPVDFLVDLRQPHIVDTIRSILVVLRANNVCVHLCEEILQQRHTSMAVQIATILGRVRYHLVHLVQLLARDGVGNERGLMQRLVIRALRLHADSNHLFKRKLDTCLDHCDHQDRVVEVLLLLDEHAACWGLLECCIRSLSPPL